VSEKRFRRVKPIRVWPPTRFLRARFWKPYKKLREPSLKQRTEDIPNLSVAWCDLGKSKLVGMPTIIEWWT
jgi:hypothetical protein